MVLTEMIVIYLACGAPFGVYHATSRRDGRQMTWLGSLSAFMLWPAFAVKLLSERLSRKAFARENRIDAVRIEMERAAFPDTNIQALFDFREIFHRFAGLAKHANANAGKPAPLAASDQTLQSRCLDRRNRNRLARHYMQAREEFIDAVSALSINCDATLTDLAVELSVHLGDPISPLEFNAVGKSRSEAEFSAAPRAAASYEVVS